MFKGLKANSVVLRMGMVTMAGAVAMGGAAAGGQTAAFGPDNPFYAASTLPYQAPPFDKIKDSDYQPAFDAGMAEQRKEIDAIANNPAAPTFENTLVALEKSGELFTRVSQVFDGVSQANTNPALDKVDEIEAPKRAALDDSIFLNEKLFKRVETLYKQMDSLGLDAESKRLLDVYYKHFVHQGANLSEADKTKLKKLNEEISTLQNTLQTEAAGGDEGSCVHHNRQECAERVERRRAESGCGRGEGSQGRRVCAATAEHDTAADSEFARRSCDAAGNI